jgi:hypothetical protein
MAKGTRVIGELARSSGHTGRAFKSTNGGLQFEEANDADSDAGMAWKTAADVDLGQMFNRPGMATVSAYARRVDSGFLSDGERSGVAANRAGGRAALDMGRIGKLTAKYDHDQKPELDQAGQVNGVDVFGMQWRIDRDKQGAAAEFEQRNTAHVNVADESQATAAVRYWIKPVDAIKATIEHQQFVSASGGQSALALEYRPFKMLSVEARGTTGEQGQSLKGGATVSMNGRQFYVKQERMDGGFGGEQSRTLFGVSAPLGPMSRAYTEYQWLKDPVGDHALSVTGLEQGWRTTSGLTASMAAEHGARSGELGDHTTVSGVLSYKSHFPLSGSTRAEVRDMSGSSNGRQVLTATRLQLALPVGFSVLSDLRLSTSKSFDQANTPVRFQENSIGLAWRAPRSDAIQVLGKLARQEDRRAAVPGDSIGTETVLGVATLEATIRVLPGLDWAAKGASRLQEDGRVGQFSAAAHSTLWTSRVDYRIVKSPLLMGVEYRMLQQRESDDNRSGWLQELSFDANKNMRFGVGYNFSRFSGDPLVRTQDTARGWFLRAQTRY